MPLDYYHLGEVSNSVILFKYIFIIYEMVVNIFLILFLSNFTVKSLYPLSTKLSKIPITVARRISR